MEPVLTLTRALTRLETFERQRRNIESRGRIATIVRFRPAFLSAARATGSPWDALVPHRRVPRGDGKHDSRLLDILDGHGIRQVGVRVPRAVSAARSSTL